MSHTTWVMCDDHRRNMGAKIALNDNLSPQYVFAPNPHYSHYFADPKSAWRAVFGCICAYLWDCILLTSIFLDCRRNMGAEITPNDNFHPNIPFRQNPHSCRYFAVPKSALRTFFTVPVSTFGDALH